ncbi:MAG TPA: 5'-3' exonuclease [Actinomycetaceae bacterium]|nr:5'-3' exonuclease [Actinomycetaceae bacterium]
MTAPLLLLDSASLYFRAFFGVPRSITAPDGTPVNAVRGFLDMIARLITDHAPDGLVACWDDQWRPAFRVAALPSYKAHRVAADGGEDVPEELPAQVDIIIEALAAVGICRLGAPDMEADDVIGTLVARELDAGEPRPIRIVTGDRDLFQLVDDEADVAVLYPARGVSNLSHIDQAELAQRYGVTSGDQYADLAILRGDPSDGIKGVPGVGEKSAAKLLSHFGDLDGIVAAVDDPSSQLTPTQRRRLAESLEYLAVAPKIVRVRRDAAVDQRSDALPSGPADPQRLAELSARWGLDSSVERLTAALADRA